MSNLTEIERKSLEALLAGEDPVLAVLRAQLPQSLVSHRTWTGYVFYTDFVVPDGCTRVDLAGDIRIRDVFGTLSGIGCGFILLVTDGAISQLECYSYEDSIPVAPEAALERLYYKGSDDLAVRNMEALRAFWNEAR